MEFHCNQNNAPSWRIVIALYGLFIDVRYVDINDGAAQSAWIVCTHHNRHNPGTKLPWRESVRACMTIVVVSINAGAGRGGVYQPTIKMWSAKTWDQRPFCDRIKLF